MGDGGTFPKGGGVFSAMREGAKREAIRSLFERWNRGFLVKF